MGLCAMRAHVHRPCIPSSAAPNWPVTIHDVGAAERIDMSKYPVEPWGIFGPRTPEEDERRRESARRMSRNILAAEREAGITDLY